jgi:Leucine-rich repeat (LRR) protein
LVIIGLFENISAKEISCEKVGDYEWLDPAFGTFKTCQMQNTTVIDEKDVKISPRDESINGLLFKWNSKIELLPIAVDQTFPNLFVYDCQDCAVKTISKENFAGLTKLKYLNLGYNYIENVNGDYFKDLVSLEKLYLRKKILFDCVLANFNFKIFQLATILPSSTVIRFKDLTPLNTWICL